MLLPTYVQPAGVLSITMELVVLNAPKDATFGEAEVMSLPISLIAPIAGIAPELTNFTYMIVSLLCQYEIGRAHV